jgi:hypothetical protein
MSSVSLSSSTERPVLRIMQTARRGDTYTVQLDYRGSQQFHSPIITLRTTWSTPPTPRLR